MSHSVVTVCLDTVSVISFVLFCALESRLAQLCICTCCVDCCHVGWVDAFTGSFMMAGQQAAPLLSWISSPGYCLCRMHRLVGFKFGKVKLYTELVQ